ncbi:MAG: heparinase II/III family protein [Clostridia bacterium]|nr:heparinase II/III family protein [Clostridia bacterium]
MTVFDNMQKKTDEIKTHPFYESYVKNIKDTYEELINEGNITLTYQDFMYFYETGSRSEYEKKYFRKREFLSCSLALCILFEEEKYLKSICEAIWSICSEISWVVPAHLLEYDVDVYDTHIDLFASETALYLAETSYLLGDKLPERIRKLISYHLNKRIFTPFEERKYWWEKLDSNWAAVCGGSIGMAYMYANPDGFNKVYDRIGGIIENFVSGYGDDGCCQEGVNYWNYGFEFFIFYADLLKRFTDGKTDIMKPEKINRMAQCLQKLIMRKDITVSFSDGARRGEFTNIGLYSYLKANFEGIEIPTMIGNKGRRSVESKPSLMLRTLFWSDPDDYVNNNREFKTGMEYFRDAKWYTNKKTKFSFAAKCGHNLEQHNHNDVGSFVIATDDGQILCDIGALEYTKENFDYENTRYKLFHNSSEGHCVPIIDGKAQKYGKEYCGEVLEVTDDTFSMEMQSAYETDLKKLVRTFNIGNDSVVLKDTYTSDKKHDIKERFVTEIEPVISDDGVRLGNLLMKTTKTPSVSSVSLRNHNLEYETFYAIDFQVDADEFEIVFVIE